MSDAFAELFGDTRGGSRRDKIPSEISVYYHDLMGKPQLFVLRPRRIGKPLLVALDISSRGDLDENEVIVHTLRWLDDYVGEECDRYLSP